MKYDEDVRDEILIKQILYRSGERDYTYYRHHLTWDRNQGDRDRLKALMNDGLLEILRPFQADAKYALTSRGIETLLDMGVRFVERSHGSKFVLEVGSREHAMMIKLVWG